MPFIPKSQIEKQESGSGSISTSTDGMVSREVTLRWLVHSIASYAEAELKGNKLAPLYYDGHRRTNMVPRSVGNGWYEIEATYGNAGIELPNAEQNSEGTAVQYGIENKDGIWVIPSGMSVDTTGGTEHITTAWADEGKDASASVTWYAKEGETAPSTGGAINVSGGRVNGVDRTVMAFSWTETWLMPAWYLVNGVVEPEQAASVEMKDPKPNVPFSFLLRGMSGRVNDKPFRSFDAGEVLFLGIKFDANRSTTMVPVSFSFSAIENRKEFKIGDILVDKKEGQDFLWVQYEDASENGNAVKRAKYVYVAKVYPRLDFAELGIGDWWPRFYLTGGSIFTTGGLRLEDQMDDDKNNLA
jgi:hypothetical protein